MREEEGAELRPYAAVARAYVQAGWLGALPLPPRRKDPVPKGYTGKQWYNVDPDSADVEKWVRQNGDGNVALRMPRDVLGIDVDAYDGKAGARSLAEAEERYGPLPPTWTSTSRLGTGSGIRFFRVPEGMKWPNTVGPGIETVHRGHRYAVAWPSIHPEGRLYCWLDPAGQAQLTIPRPSQLAELPATWIEGLTQGEMASAATERAEASSADMKSWLTTGEVCAQADRKLEEALAVLDSGAGSRHDSIRDLSLAILYYGQQGHGGVETCMRILQRRFLEEVGKDRQRGQAEREWESFVIGAAGIIAARPRPSEHCTGGDCEGSKLAGVPDLPVLPASVDPLASLGAPLAAPEPEPVPEEGSAGQEAREDHQAPEGHPFWDARPILRHVHDFARARMCSPWAVLGVVLARAIVTTPPYVVLPPIIGSVASLNLFVALVGPSGAGKGAAEQAAADAVDLGQVDIATVGSGEGIGHLYARRERGEVIQERTAVLFTVPEVDNLVALGSRQGSTLLPQLRSAWSGEKLGFSYADKNKALPIERHTYRMGLSLGVQPGRAAPILEDADGGTPQRFVWLPALDAEAPDETPEAPERVLIPSQEWRGGGSSFLLPLAVPEEAKQVIRQARLARLRGEGTALDGHGLLCRLKVAAALALLDQRRAVVDDDWRLAGIVMEVSDRTRAWVQDHLARSRQEENTTKGKAEAARKVIVEETVANRAAARVAAGILRRLQANGPTPWGQARRLLPGRDREHFEEAVERLVQAGQVLQEDGPRGVVLRTTEEDK